MVNIICMKWGTKYHAHHVNQLFASVKFHLKRPYRFICFTDDSKDICAAVETMPLPSFRNAEGVDRGWPKLAMFSPELADITGTALFLDLDIVIVGGLDEFFDLQGDFWIIKDWKRPWRLTGNSSVFRFEIGQMPDVLENFDNNFEVITKRYRNEQEYLSHYLFQKDKLQYWPSTWCQSFKYTLIPIFPRNFWQTPKPGLDARIIVFHGCPKPEEAIYGISNKWYRFYKPARWIADTWLKY